MPQNLTPVDKYSDFPVEVPVDGDLRSATTLKEGVFQDTYNRILHLKNLADAASARISALETDVGTLETSVTEAENSLVTAQQDITEINELTGSNTFTDANYITTGINHEEAALELDTQLKITTDLAEGHTTDITTAEDNITSLVGKISEDALDGQDGFAFTDADLLSANDNTEEALGKLDSILYATNRIADNNYAFLTYLWATTNSYIYNTFINSSKTYSSSTPGAYDNLRQRFGLAASSWTFYSVAESVPVGTNTVKAYWTTYPDGACTVYASATGYEGPYTEISDLDTETTIGAGNSLVVKVVGNAGNYLQDFRLQYYTV